MNKINIGLIGYGNVGQGVVKLLKKRRNFVKAKYDAEFILKTLCDRSVHKKDTKDLEKTLLTTSYNDVLNDPEIKVVIELIGGLNPAREIVTKALQQGKHVITANKELIANHGKELFPLARQHNAYLYFESCVGAGIPIISTITQGMAGNKFNALYGIINGTCNFILTKMTQDNLSFAQALEEAQRLGFAEKDPTLDINGMDSTHKLAILAYLTFGKFLDVKNIYTEGISHISHDDIEYAESLGLTIKLLGIAKRVNEEIEVRVHPTLFSKEHPLASINNVYNAIFLNADPLGNILISGEGAGQMSAAIGVFGDLINLSSRGDKEQLLCNYFTEDEKLLVRSSENFRTKFYLRFTASDKPGVLSQITGILGKYNIGINSVTQKAHNPMASVPVIMLTDYTVDHSLREALAEIHKLPVVKAKTVAIRMEKLW
ncbi:MAG: homoserine dehydrogenase [Candidatus Omnitrophota bacterium]|jgi:homoserine dehydrogenase|nr:homoserine dehydrogenase [Candidatus Omnitrophota bacterium]